MTTTASHAAAGTVERPTSVGEAAGLLRDSRGTVLFRGGGTKMAWAGRPRAADLVLETGGLQRMLTHNPADMTASVEAGMPLATLQERLAEAGQWLALDPPTEAQVRAGPQGCSERERFQQEADRSAMRLAGAS